MPRRSVFDWGTKFYTGKGPGTNYVGQRSEGKWQLMGADAEKRKNGRYRGHSHKIGCSE